MVVLSCLTRIAGMVRVRPSVKRTVVMLDAKRSELAWKHPSVGVLLLGHRRYEWPPP